MQYGDLISIGDLSKLTGVHIKALRYYDKIGILKPAYVNPETGYRYYSFLQSNLVEAIQLCVEVGIPLKTFSEFVSEDKSEIYYAKLLEYGRKVAEQKIKKIQGHLAYIEESQEELRRTEKCRENGAAMAFELPEKYCLAAPYEGQLTVGEYQRILKDLRMGIREQGCLDGYEFGKIAFYEGATVQRYVFFDLWEGGSKMPKDVRYIPAQTYLCRCMQESSIERAEEIFADQFQCGRSHIVIETEMFTGDYNFLSPTFELRCSNNAK